MCLNNPTETIRRITIVSLQFMVSACISGLIAAESHEPLGAFLAFFFLFMIMFIWTNYTTNWHNDK